MNFLPSKIKKRRRQRRIHQKNVRINFSQFPFLLIMTLRTWNLMETSKTDANRERVIFCAASSSAFADCWEWIEKADCVWVIDVKWCLVQEEKKHWEKDGKDAWRVVRLRSIYVDFVWLSRAAPARACVRSDRIRVRIAAAQKFYIRQTQVAAAAKTTFLLFIDSATVRSTLSAVQLYSQDFNSGQFDLSQKFDEIETWRLRLLCGCFTLLMSSGESAHTQDIDGGERELWKRRLVWIWYFQLSCVSMLEQQQRKKHNTKRGKCKQKMNFD